MAEIVARMRPYRHVAALWPLCLGGIWFTLLQCFVRDPAYLLYVPLDDFVPFLPLFIVPYVIWYFYVLGTALFLFRNSPEEFTKNVYFLGLGMFIACLCYTLLPNGQALRPDLTGATGALNAVIRLLYSIDPPTNSAPSIHVIFAVASHSALARYLRQRGAPLWTVGLSLLVSVCCILSTVFVKQHSVVDLLAGLLVSGLLYFLVYFLSPSKATRVPVRKKLHLYYRSRL